LGALRSELTNLAASLLTFSWPSRMDSIRPAKLPNASLLFSSSEVTVCSYFSSRSWTGCSRADNFWPDVASDSLNRWSARLRNASCASPNNLPPISLNCAESASFASRISAIRASKLRASASSAARACIASSRSAVTASSNFCSSAARAARSVAVAAARLPISQPMTAPRARATSANAIAKLKSITHSTRNE
jgi:hypothetical protein